MLQMTGMNRPLILGIGAAAVAAATMWGVPAYADYITDFGDFDNGNLGGQQGWVVSDGVGSAQVIESDPLFPSPSSLKYVKMEGGHTNNGITEASYDFAPTPTLQPVEFEFVWAYRNPRSSGGTDNIFHVHLTGADNNGTGAYIAFRDRIDNTTGKLNVNYGSTNGTTIATVTNDQFYTIKISFAGGTPGDLNQAVSVEVREMDGDLVGQLLNLPYDHAGDAPVGVNQIRFRDAGFSSQVIYLDSVSVDVVPEPATMGLILTGSILTMSRRSR